MDARWRWQGSMQIAERSLHLSRRSFREVGNSGVAQVLDASRSYQRARLALAEARSAISEHRPALCGHGRRLDHRAAAASTPGVLSPEAQPPAFRRQGVGEG